MNRGVMPTELGGSDHLAHLGTVAPVFLPRRNA
jgi:hypothetical protein